MTTERDGAVRALLVETASRPPRRQWRGTALVAAIAFLLGGGITAGALSATAATRESSLPPDTSQEMISMFLHGGHTIGPLVSHSGSGPARIDLGPRPADATGIAAFIDCGGSGNLVQTVGGDVGLEQECASDSGIGSSSEKDPIDSIVSVKPDRDFDYTVSAQWIFVPGPSGPSAAQQAAVADGIVTDAEYRAAVDRFAACMTGAGYPLSDIEYAPQLSYGMSTEAAKTGTVDRCQDSELNQVVELWQAQQ